MIASVDRLDKLYKSVFHEEKESIPYFKQKTSSVIFTEVQ